jgi:tetratricopeptide (TPR) repeat protein
MLKAKEIAPKAVPYFNEVIEKFPNTDYADLSYVQLGMCYEYLENWEESEKSYGDLIKKYTDENGNPVAPYSQNVVQAVAYARRRKGDIMAYRLSIKAAQQAGGQ